MDFESLKEPFTPLISAAKGADTYIRRQYTKAAEGWKGKGFKLSYLTNSLSLSGYLAVPKTVLFAPFGYFVGTDIVRNMYENDEKTTEGPMAENIVLYAYRQLGTCVRLPMWGAGLGYTIQGLAGVCQGVFGDEPMDVGACATSLSIGWGFLSTSSSIYLKDSDPALLDKDPFWMEWLEKAEFALRPKAPAYEPSRRLEDVIESYQTKKF